MHPCGTFQPSDQIVGDRPSVQPPKKSAAVFATEPTTAADELMLEHNISSCAGPKKMQPLAHGHSVGIYFAYIALIGGVSDGGGAAERRRPPWSRGVGMVFYAVLVSEKLSVGSARRNVIVCRGLPRIFGSGA